jgi:hypothetical protein
MRTELHRQAFVVDMHADTLLWPKRDFFRRNEWAHVDLPRLQEGNVALQMFTIVTSVPYGQSFESNYAPTNPAIDKLTPKVAVEVQTALATQSPASLAVALCAASSPTLPTRHYRAGAGTH